MVLKNKTILITGGSKGIGRACVEAFAEQGANIIINYAHDEKGAKEAADVASKHGVKTLVVQANITKQAEVDAMFTKVKTEFSSLDVVVNNAGTFAEGDSPDNVAAIQEVFDTNLFAQIRVTNAARRTATPMWGEMDGARKTELAAGHLINRWIEPREIADGAVFLAKNDAVCGEVLVIDGGMSLKVLG